MFPVPTEDDLTHLRWGCFWDLSRCCGICHLIGTSGQGSFLHPENHMHVSHVKVSMWQDSISLQKSASGCHSSFKLWTEEGSTRTITWFSGFFSPTHLETARSVIRSVSTCAPFLPTAAVDGVQLVLPRSGCGSGGSTWIRQARMKKVQPFVQGGPLPVLSGVITPMVL